MTTTASEWNERYSASGRVWSGQPNGLLVQEVEGLSPGAALDVGAGEGADAVWLASHGWQVTAVDISSVAIARARSAGEDAGVDVTWLVSDIADVSGQFDLVSAFYPSVPKGTDMFQHICNLVAPGGTLLFVHHVPPSRVPDGQGGHGHHSHGGPHGHGQHKGPDFNKFMSVADARAALGDGWDVVKDDVIARHLSCGAGAHHRLDGILRAVRLEPTA
ncbi:class I SAM-dependent methyltransferase [Trueperella pyogenes]|uniref:class I SAM-dependent methyltransferase n=1 Tax=Trueperella pyogenes TaxID=1661 RepID=UPI00345CEAEF